MTLDGGARRDVVPLETGLRVVVQVNALNAIVVNVSLTPGKV